jgi:zinc transporter 9
MDRKAIEEVFRMAGGSKRAVGAAILGNSLITIAKTGAFLISGSASMLSEALHSAADTMNQILLMIGITRSTREADPSFPFGYGAERAVWALMSGVGIFFLGCGVTLYHGFHNLLHPKPLQSLGVALIVLFLSLIVEGIVLVIAVRAVKERAAGKPFFKFLRVEADPTTAAVVLEDAAACLGVLIALAGIALSRWTGNPMWDAVGSILVGLLLGAIAVWLITKSRHLLVGPAVPAAVHDRIQKIIARDPAVAKIVRLRTRVMDSETYRVAAEIEFAGDTIADSFEDELRAAYPKITDYDGFRAFAADFADQVIERLGDEIDEIEDAIQSEVPKARYLDIEAE